MDKKEKAKALALGHQKYKRDFDSKSPEDDRRVEAKHMVSYSVAMQEHLTAQGIAYTPPELPGEKGYWTHVVSMGDGEKSIIHNEEDAA